MRIVIPCLGSQGDIRPFAALGLALKAEGHDVLIASNPSNEEFCQQHGIDFTPLPGDIASIIQPGECGLGKTQVVRKLGQIINKSIHQQFEVLSPLLRNFDAVVYHPAVFAIDHIVESVKIPSIRIHFQPDIRTRKYACCLFPPKMPFGGWGNLASHFIAAQVFWLLLRKTINKWRTGELGLKKLGFFAPTSYPPIYDVPKLIAASQTLITPAPDWPENVQVTGYMELPMAKVWTPPAHLQKFLDQGDPPLYVGFGSLTERCDEKMTRAIIDVLQELSIRTILSGKFHYLKKEQLPEHILWIESAPHDWLFPRVQAIVHHGGAGTTHASLLAGKPTLIVPYVVDQFHWGDKVYRFGLGPRPLPAKKLMKEAFRTSVEQLLKNPSYQSHAEANAEKMQQENGVERVVEFLKQHLETFK